MTSAYGIVVPIAGQPISESQFGTPVKTAIEDLETRMGVVEGGTTDRPICLLRQQAAQSIPNGSVDTAITFGSGSEIIKTDSGLHSTSSNPSRIILLKAGYWRLTGNVMFAAPGASTTLLVSAVIGLNGTPEAPRARVNHAAANVSRATGEVTTILLSNGTTDYAQLFGAHDYSASLNTNAGGSFVSSLFAEFIRPA